LHKRTRKLMGPSFPARTPGLLIVDRRSGIMGVFFTTQCEWGDSFTPSRRTMQLPRGMRCIGGFELLCSRSPFEPAVSVEGGLDR
jgi:hypothetical protein